MSDAEGPSVPLMTDATLDAFPGPGSSGPAARRGSVDAIRTPLPPDQLVMPPTPNTYIVGLASAQVLADDELIELSSGADPIAEPWRSMIDERLANALLQANEGYFHFALRSLHEVGGPEVISFVPESTLGGLEADRSTRKVTMVLPLRSVGSDAPAVLAFPQSGREASLVPGGLLMFPSYLFATFAMAPGQSLDALVTYAIGPAFR